MRFPALLLRAPDNDELARPLAAPPARERGTGVAEPEELATARDELALKVIE